MLRCDSEWQCSGLRHLLSLYGISLVVCAEGEALTGSYWGDAEAGIACVDDRLVLFLCADTPVHSVLHEAAHVVCMTADRRAVLFQDAGGDFAEENAVCYLQILWADLLPGTNRDQLMQDMDTWGYSFRLGSTRQWFEGDADDARLWLLERKMISAAGEPTGRLNEFTEAISVDQRAA